jgi:hypothetical protein
MKTKRILVKNHLNPKIKVEVWEIILMILLILSVLGHEELDHKDD